MSKSLPLAIILLLALIQLKGQSTSTLSGAKTQGVGNASSCLFNEWAILNNIGGLAKQEAPSAALTYTVNSFLPNGNSQALAFSIPFESFVAGLAGYSFGDQLYREQLLSAGIANQFGLASLGLRLNYIQYRIEGFGQKGLASINLGGVAEITPSFSIGAHIMNMNQPKITTHDDERISTKLIIGIRYDPSDKVFITAEIEKDIEYSPTYKVGLAYQPQTKITFRTGFNLHPNAAFFGIGVTHKRFLIDYSLAYRIALGISNQASLGYQFQKR